MTQEEFKKNHSDSVWRLHNLYTIKHAKTGRAIPFIPRAEQKAIIDAVFVHGHRNILIPKARQLGISTVICLIILDSMLFHAGVQCAIVDLTQGDATKKLRQKILFAFNYLPKILLSHLEVTKSNDHVLSFRKVGSSADDESEVQAGMNARGDTFQVLMVSEWGKIAYSDPIRSTEILTGALPAAKQGLRFVETTWKGAKTGDLWNIMRQAMETREEDLTVEDWRLFFFPWWGDPDYALDGNASQVSEEVTKYLDETQEEIRRRGIRGADWCFSPRQRLWYYKVAMAKGLYRYEEFPSLLEECFKSPIEGAIYADLIDRARAAGAIIPKAEVDRTVLVHTAWDLGSPVNTVVWYFQLVLGEIRVIDCDCDQDLTPAERVAQMLAKGYLFGWHFMPHDALGTQRSGRTFQMEVDKLGLHNTRVVPQTQDIWIGINHLRGMFGRLTFRMPHCERGLDMLSAYHTKRETAGGAAFDMPVHDSSSHYADALRVIAEADEAGMLQQVGGKRKANVRTGYRGSEPSAAGNSSVLDLFFGRERGKGVRVMR